MVKNLEVPVQVQDVRLQLIVDAPIRRRPIVVEHVVSGSLARDVNANRTDTMGFLTSLAKGFIRSAVNQVGRDGGRIISGKIYQSSYATPAINTVTVKEGEAILKYKKPNLLSVVVIDLIVFCIPFIGFITLLVKTITCFTKRKEPIVGSAPVRVRDRRYKFGYRIDGYTQATIGYRDLHSLEIQNLRLRGKYHLVTWVLIVVAGLVYKAITLYHFKEL